VVVTERPILGPDHAAALLASNTERLAPALPEATVIVPAFNEEDGLPVVLRSLAAVLDERFEVLVVDDGSTDRTAEMAMRAGHQVIRHERNLGKGCAIQTGLRNARGTGVVLVDADGTYPVSIIPLIAECLKHYEAVFAARTIGRINMPLLNRAGNAAFRGVIRLAAGRGRSDPLSGLYGVRRKLMQRMNLTSPGFGIEAEIVIKSARLGLRTLDLPVEYGPRYGETKLSPVRDGLVILRTVLAHAGGALRSPRVDSRTTAPPGFREAASAPVIADGSRSNGSRSP